MSVFARSGPRGRFSRLHHAIQRITANWLSSWGFDVYLEERLGEDLVADVYAESPWGSVVVEVETGFIDPRAVETPEKFLLAKIVAKASRYSIYADTFVVALPSFLSLDIEALRRIIRGDYTVLGGGGAWEVLRLVRRPRLGSLWDARVDAVFWVNVSEGSIRARLLGERGARVLGGLGGVE